MLLLVTDTSGKQGSVALARAGERDRNDVEVIEVAPLAGGMFSAQLVPQIAALLDKHGSARPISMRFIVVSGPGSFTGLRVGLAAIKALARDSEEAHRGGVAAGSCGIRQAGSQGKVVAVLDAGRGDVYFGAYEIAGDSVQVLQEQLLSKAEFLSAAAGSTVITPDLALADRGAGSRVFRRSRSNLRALR